MKDTKRVLIVDDDEDVVHGAKLWLSAAGFEVHTAFDGESALPIAVKEQPDVVVLDVRMPGKNGLVTMAALHDMNDTKSIPIVMLSASLIDQQKALDDGAQFFLPKPYTGKELVEAVEAAMQLAPRRVKPQRVCISGVTV